MVDAMSIFPGLHRCQLTYVGKDESIFYPTNKTQFRQKRGVWKCMISAWLVCHRVFKCLVFLFIKNTGHGIKAWIHAPVEIAHFSTREHEAQGMSLEEWSTCFAQQIYLYYWCMDSLVIKSEPVNRVYDCIISLWCVKHLLIPAMSQILPQNWNHRVCHTMLHQRSLARPWLDPKTETCY